MVVSYRCIQQQFEQLHHLRANGSHSPLVTSQSNPCQTQKSNHHNQQVSLNNASQDPNSFTFLADPNVSVPKLPARGHQNSLSLIGGGSSALLAPSSSLHAASMKTMVKSCQR